MTRPTIEMKWGGGKWKTGHKKAVRPYVESALDLTDSALNYLGLSYILEKTATIFRVYDSFPDHGCAVDSANFEMYVRCQDILRNRVSRRLGTLATTSIHELTHCIRMEKVDDGEADSLIECVASEGISYWAEYTIAREIMHGPELDHEYGGLFDPMPNKVMSQLTEHLACDNEEVFDDGIYDVWFDNGGSFHSAGNRLGIICVGNLLDDGKSLVDIIDMHASEIIGIS